MVLMDGIESRQSISALSGHLQEILRERCSTKQLYRVQFVKRYIISWNNWTLLEARARVSNDVIDLLSMHAASVDISSSVNGPLRDTLCLLLEWLES